MKHRISHSISAKLTGLLSALPLALAALNAQADNLKTERPAAVSENKLSIGAGVGVSPKYSGSDQLSVGLTPIFDYSMKNGFFIGSRGIGYEGQVGPLDYTAALGYRGNRKESDSNRFNGRSGSAQLHGMGDIKASATLNLGAHFMPLKWLHLSAIAELPISQRNNGKALHFGSAAIVHASNKNSLTVGAIASVGDSNYTQTYYGVSAAQAANSGLAKHTTKAGLYEVGSNLAWKHTINPTWSVTTSVGITRLTGSAANSPITKRKLAPNAGTYVRYTF